ncbi:MULTISPECIES: HlyD family secretion protein [unclassified Acetobacter]|nr:MULTISPECIES: HlyD family secretion protein [unclassified Acetobacter]
MEHQGSVTTNDAYIHAYFTLVAPKVSGRIDQVEAQDNQHVKAGETLAHIQDWDFQASLRIARANVASAQSDIDNLSATLKRQQPLIAAAHASVESDKAALAFARLDEARYRDLSAGGAGTVEQRQRTATQAKQTLALLARDEAEASAAEQQVPVIQAQLERARAALQRAQGEEKQAELNLSYCTITAPIDGVVGARGVRVGAYVHVGTALLGVIPVQDAFVVANFQETQLTHVMPGQRATVWVDTFPGHPLRAHVDSVARATGVAFSPIQPDNATGNFTKVVQRLPVRIVFDPGQPLAARVSVGMSVEVRIDTETKADGSHASDDRYEWR